MTKDEALKVANVLDHKEVTAHVEDDGMDGTRLVLLIDNGPNAPAYRLVLEDVGWSIEQGNRLIAWNPMEL